VPRITDFCSCIYVLGCKLSLVRHCDSDFGITPVDDITIGITCAAVCFHIAHISFASPWYLFCLSAIVLARLCCCYYYYYYYYYYWTTISCMQICLSTTRRCVWSLFRRTTVNLKHTFTVGLMAFTSDGLKTTLCSLITHNTASEVRTDAMQISIW